MSFWKNKGANPKRKFRFKIEISHPSWGGGENGQHVWYAKSCTAPSVEVSSVEHMWSDHVFNFPGRAKWGDVEMVLVDPAGGGDGPDSPASGEIAAADPNTVKSFAGILQAFNYEIPTGGGITDDDYKTVSRNQIQNCLIVIQSLDDEGKVIEKWTLNNAFPTAFKFGDWDYGSDDLREMNITWKYDWATLENIPATDKFF